MELPKNIIQIGEPDPRSKIYAEDYVITYMKQMNEKAADRPVAMAFYGEKREIEGKSCYFFYGAARLESLMKDCTHLSQAQRQEIEKLRKTYFKDYSFLGYRVLEGNMVEGFYLYEQGIGRYVSGYAGFSEKNDAMLNFMMDTREEQIMPEAFEQQKYEEVKKRQEQRREETLYHYKSGMHKKGAVLRYGSVACAAALGFLIFRNLDNPFIDKYVKSGKNLVLDAKENVESLFEKDAAEVSGRVSVEEKEKTEIKDILVTEDNLTKALLEENSPKEKKEIIEPQEPSFTGVPEDSGITDTSEVPASEGQNQETATEVENTEAVTDAEVVMETPTYEEYMVQKGDTLISICTLHYGNKDMVPEICRINQIDNPDNIQVGWKILLP